MSDFLSAMGTLFTFLFSQLGSCATFFTSNTFGQIIFGIVLFGLIITLFVKILTILKR